MKLLATTTRVVGTPHMLFSNPMMITHVNITVNQPLMSSLTDVGYKSTNVKNSKGGYRKPFVITIGMPNHINGHSVRPNKVPLKYLDFKKYIDIDVHVKVFNFTMKANVKTFEKYIINMLNYTLKDTTSNWCHNYMSKFLEYIFLELTQAFYKHYQKIQNDEQIYMELKNMK